MMNGEQVTAFKGSTGGLLPAQLFDFIFLTMLVICFLWLAWLVFSSFRLWHEGGGNFYWMTSFSIRGAVVLLFIGYLFTL